MGRWARPILTGLCTLFLAVHSSLTDINDVNSSRAMNPACRPHSKQRSATDSFGWPSNPSVRSSGSRRNSGCPPGRTWDVSWEAAGVDLRGMIMFEAALYTLEWYDIPRCYTRPKLIFALLVTRLSQECDTRPELKSNN